MSEIISVPSSVREKLERAISRPHEAGVQLSEAGRAIAHADPHLAALLTAAAMGFTRIGSSSIETTTTISVRTRTILGIPVAVDRHTVIEVRTNGRTVRFI